MLTNVSRLALAAAFVAAAPAMAGDSAAGSGKNPGKNVIQTQPEAEKSVYDKIWDVFSLYKSDTGFLNEVSLTGRYHGTYYSADNGTNESDWDNRRLRLGAQATFLNKKAVLKFEMFSDLNSSTDEVASGLAGGQFYDGFTEASLRLQPSDEFNITIGKQKPKFSQEWTTSSRLLLAFERGQAIAQFRPDYASGVSIDGKLGGGEFDYYAGVFSNDTQNGPTDESEFGEFEGGHSIVAGLGMDLKAETGFDAARIGVSYVHSDANADSDIFNVYEDGAALSFSMTQGDFGLASELLYGSGAVGENFGFSITPTYFIIPKKLQAVLRGQVCVSDSADGLAVRTRYEKIVGGTSGDTYTAVYGGLNYYLYDHKLKLMAGAEYANMDGGTGAGYDGWTFLTGVRLYF
jgi:phosphate-selective porin OprO and OprP